MKKVKNYFVKAIVGIVAFSTMLSGCAKTSTKSDDDHLTVFLWESKLVKNLAPYIRSQLPDMDIEFISGNNTDLYEYYQEHGELPDIISVRRFSGTDSKELQPYLLDLSSYDIVSKYYSYALQYYFNKDQSINWLPICGIPQTIIANKTLFDQYGIALPTNYEEYVEACQKFNDLGIKPNSMDMGEDWSCLEAIQGGAIDEFTSLEGLEWRSKAESADDKISFDEEMGHRVFSKTNQFLKDSYFTAEDVSLSIDDGTNMFVEKKSAIFHGTPDIYKNLSQEMKDSELVRLPYFSHTSNEGYIYMHPSLNVALNSDLENNKTKLDLALKVLDCMVSKKGQQLIANGSGVISFNQGVPSMMNDVKGLEESLKNNNIYIRYSAQKSFVAAKEVVHGLLTGQIDENSAHDIFCEIMNSKSDKEKAVVHFDKDYSIYLNDKNGRDAPSSILTTVRKAYDAKLAFVPYYYFTSSIYKGDCTASQLGLMLCHDSNTYLNVKKLSGKDIYGLVEKHLKEFNVKDKYSLPIASGMKLVFDQNYKLKDILVNGKSIDFDKKYSILLSDSTDSSNASLASAWVSAMSKQDQPSKPEDYIKIGS